MRIVVDTNIVFSAILNTNSKYSKILLQPKSKLNFYSTNQLRDEIAEHWIKLRKLSGYTDVELHKIKNYLFEKITFINLELIPKSIFKKAEELVSQIDIDDTEFIALTDHIRGKLWSGDKELIKGLKKLGWSKIISTDELLILVANR